MTRLVDFIIKDLPSVLILIITDQIFNYLLCFLPHSTCVYVYLYILLLIVLINLSEICRILHEIFWIKLKPE